MQSNDDCLQYRCFTKNPIIMKNKFFILPVLLLSFFMFIAVELISFTTGAPTNASGSPSNNNITCVQCHASNNNNRTGWITSTELNNGYSPGMNYNMRARALKSGCEKFGFLITIEKDDGTKAGTPVATDATRTQVKDTYYITHTAAGTAGQDSAVWEFLWNSPATPMGTVTFYGAFIGANNDNQNTGDVVYISTTDVILQGTQGIAQKSENGNKLYLFPNPAVDFVNLNLQHPVNNASLFIYNMAGQVVKEINWEYANKMTVDVSTLTDGVYLTRLVWDNDMVSSKLIIRKQ